MSSYDANWTGFKNGDRVKVIHCRSYKKYDYTGMIGTVTSKPYSAYSSVCVRLDNVVNPNSGGGLFYFRPSDLMRIPNNNNDILEENTMQNVVNYFNIAKIQYLDNNQPSNYYYANFDASLTVGDLCVVKSLHHGLGLAKVTEIIEQNDIQTPREIVAKVDTQDYDFRVKSRKAAAELKAKMQERAKQLQDIALYQMLAKEDSEMQELLNSYQNLPLY